MTTPDSPLDGPPSGKAGGQTGPPRSQQIVTAGVLGALAGAALGSHRGGRKAALGALAGAVGLGTVEAVARARQRPGQIPALVVAGRRQRCDRGSGRLGGRSGDGRRARGGGRRRGAVAGGLGLRPQKVALGPVLGAAIGRGLATRPGLQAPAVVAAATVVGFRVVSALVFRDPQVSLLAERVTAAELPFVVPLEARARYVGTGYVARAGRRFSAASTSPTPQTSASSPPSTSWQGRTSTRRRPIHWCASSTSTPPGSPWTSCRSGGIWVRPGYLLYRNLLARPLGQANVPMNQRETQRGIRSRIDTIRAPGRRHRGGTRLDPVLRRQRRADLHGHLHHLPQRRTAATSASASRCPRPASPPPCSPKPAPTAA